MDIVDTLKVPRSVVYGDHRHQRLFGRPIEALLQGRIVETRVILGERGRGGKMVKVRVRYDSEPVKLLLDRLELTREGR